MESFNEWLDTTKLRGYMDENSLEAAYEAGQQSKQAEIDELKREMLNKTNEAYADGQKSMRKMIKSNEDELRKRIDVLSKKLNEMAHIFLDDLDEILKGNTNDH